MSKVTVNREYKYLWYLIILLILGIAITEGYIAYCNSFTKYEFFADEGIGAPYDSEDNMVYYRYMNDIENGYTDGRAFLLFVLILIMAYWYSKTNIKFIKVTFIVLIISIVVYLPFYISEDSLFSDRLTRDLWQIRLFYIFFCIPFLLMIYDKIIIGVLEDKIVYERKKLKQEFYIKKEKLDHAFNNEILSKVEYDNKLSSIEKEYFISMIERDDEFLDYKKNVDEALKNDFISKKEYDIKIEDFKKEKLNQQLDNDITNDSLSSEELNKSYNEYQNKIETKKTDKKILKKYRRKSSIFAFLYPILFVVILAIVFSLFDSDELTLQLFSPMFIVFYWLTSALLINILKKKEDIKTYMLVMTIIFSLLKVLFEVSSFLI